MHLNPKLAASGTEPEIVEKTVEPQELPNTEIPLKEIEALRTVKPSKSMVSNNATVDSREDATEVAEEKQEKEEKPLDTVKELNEEYTQADSQEKKRKAGGPPEPSPYLKEKKTLSEARKREIVVVL